MGSNGRMLQFTNHLLSSVESITGGSHRLHMVMEENSRTRYRERINGRVSRIPFESNEYEDQYMVGVIEGVEGVEAVEGVVID